jgi:hypothetical protein
MNTNYLKIIFFSIAICFLVGGACPSNETTQSNKIAQSEIYQSYAVREAGEMLEVTAFFRIGGDTGTTLALIPPSKISFNGQPLKENLNTSSGTFYSIEIPKQTPTGTFQFTDRQGKNYSNKIELSKVSMLSKNITSNGITPISIPLSNSVSEDASINVALASDYESTTLFIGPTFEAEFGDDRKMLSIKPETWTKFKSGNVSMNLNVKESIPVQQGTSLGGNLTYTYETPKINIALSKSKAKVAKIKK